MGKSTPRALKMWGGRGGSLWGRRYHKKRHPSLKPDGHVKNQSRHESTGERKWFDFEIQRRKKRVLDSIILDRGKPPINNQAGEYRTMFLVSCMAWWLWRSPFSRSVERTFRMLISYIIDMSKYIQTRCPPPNPMGRAKKICCIPSPEEWSAQPPGIVEI